MSGGGLSGQARAAAASGYGDIRDVLVALPHGEPDTSTNYVRTDIFTVRHQLIRQLSPAPRSVFEFGALYGYFLVTALDAATGIVRVGWVDDESHTPGSNRMCLENVRSVWAGDDFEVHESRDTVPSGAAWWDLVQVDAGHSYDECLADLECADRSHARWVFVDDWGSHHHGADLARAVETFLAWSASGWILEEHATVNGLAVLTRLEVGR